MRREGATGQTKEHTAMATAAPIAIMGFQLESNSHSPECQASEFFQLSGDDLLADIASQAPRAPRELTAFMAEAKTLGLTPAPLASATAGASGRIGQDFIDGWMAAAVARLRDLGPVAGVYLCQHGAAISTGSEDPDGDFYALVRAVVGPEVPIVVTLDPHANVSAKMLSNIDAIIAYHTNPHVDQQERGREAAHLMARLVAGQKTEIKLAKLPMIPPSISQVTKGGPLGEHIAYGQSFLDDDEVMAVCTCSGFSLGDNTKAGMSVAVTVVEGAGAKAQTIADTVAQRIWDERNRYDITMTSLEDAVAMAKALDDPAQPALCFADVADNPGSGGRGNTTYILKAFLDAGVSDAILAPFYDAPLALQAASLGVGARFTATFNSAETQEFSQPLTAEVEVLAVGGGVQTGRRGMYAGRSFDLGTAAVLRCDGIRIVVTEKRIQFLDPLMLECLGMRMQDTRALIVKSRGHFRAAVDEAFADDQIIEVDVPGLATPMLHRITFTQTPRPIYPLDRDMTWSAIEAH